MSSYRIIYPGGDTKKLDVAWVIDYEEDHWALASRQHFEEESDAAVYARELAKKHGLSFESDSQEAIYLD